VASARRPSAAAMPAPKAGSAAPALAAAAREDSTPVMSRDVAQAGQAVHEALQQVTGKGGAQPRVWRAA
jgi:hypothetical protein